MSAPTYFTSADGLAQIGWWGRHGPGYPWRFDRSEDPTQVWLDPKAEWVAAFIVAESAAA